MTDETYWILACRVWEGKASSAENAQFEAWAKQDDNAPLVAHYRRLWQLTAPASAPEFQAGEHWPALESRLALPEQPQTVRMVPLWMKIAASLLLLAAAFFYLPSLWTQELISIQSGRGQQLVTLPDRSRVWLNAQSTIRYPKVFTASRRRVFIEGEAFFDVTKDPARPFVIESASTETTVLGTSFNVHANAGMPVTVTVVTGKVQFGPLADARQRLILLPGDAGTFDPQRARLASHANDDPYFMMWHNRTLAFNKMPLARVLASLEKVYAVTIKTTSPVSPACVFTGTFENATLPEILAVIQASVGFELSENNGSYIIQNISCP